MRKSEYDPKMPESLRNEIYGGRPNNRRVNPRQGINNQPRNRTSNNQANRKSTSSRPSKNNTPKNINRSSNRNFETNRNSQYGVKKSQNGVRNSQNRNNKTTIPKNMVRPEVKKKKKKTKKKSFKRLFFGFIIMVLHILGQAFNFIRTGGDKKLYQPKQKIKKLNIKFSRIFTIVSMGVFLYMTICILLINPKVKSVEENRDLAQKPAFSISNYFDGKYTKKYASYLSDQFPFRNSFVKTKAKVDLLLGKKELNGVYIGKYGYLMEGFKYEPKSEMEKKAAAVNLLAKKYPSMNTSVMLVPNKCEILKNYLPKNAPVDSEVKYLDDIRGMFANNINFINLIDTFNANKASTELYFKTDHHWTADGAYKAYVQYMNSLSIVPTPETSFKKSLASNSFLGSLYYKNGADIGSEELMYLYLKNGVYPLVVRYFDKTGRKTTVYDREKINSRDPYEVFTGGNHAQIKIRTAVESDRKLLIFKDSYANAMIPFLINNFAEITVVDLRYYTDKLEDIFNNNDITDILVLYNVKTFSTDSSILNLEELKTVKTSGDGSLKYKNKARKNLKQ